MEKWIKGSLVLCIAVVFSCAPGGTPADTPPDVYKSPLVKKEQPSRQSDAGEDVGEERPDLAYLPTQYLGDALVTHAYYTVSYSSRHKNAEWVAYELSAARIAKDDVPRRHSFKKDPEIEGSAKSSMYSKTGYDRGHLAPAHDMNFSKKAMSESFYMSNVSPQVPAFNRGIWKELEGKVRGWAEDEGHLFIITGPILRQRLAKDTERLGGAEGPTVPRGFFKVVLDYSGAEKKGIAFMFKNKDIDKELEAFAVPIEKVEEYTKLNFFPELTEEESSRLEKEINLADWNI